MHAGEQFAAQQCGLCALWGACTFAGVQVQDQAVRVGSLALSAEPPLGHMNFQSGHLAEPRQHGGFIDQGVAVDVVLVLEGCRGIQSGAEFSRSLRKKTFPGSSGMPAPLTQRFRVAGLHTAC